MLGKFKGKALAVVLVTVMLSISLSPMIFNNQMGTQPQSSQSGNYPSTIFGSLQQYAEEHGTTVEQITANWTADDWLRWYKYEGNPSWGSTNITDQFLATDWVKLPNSGNLTWGADYDYEYKYNSTSDQLEMWHNGTLVSYLGSDDLWHYASDRPNLTDLHHMTDKEYVDNAVASLGARYYMVNTSSGISDYKLTQLSPPSGSEQSVTKSGLVDDDYIAGWISPDTSMSKLIKGVYNWHVYAEKTGGTQTLRLYWQLVERKSDTTETIIATSAVSNEISTSEGSYIIPLILSEDYTLADGSYIVGKLYADVSGGGSSPNVAIYYDGSSKSHWEIPINLEIFSDQFLKLDGSNANSDIDITPYNLTVNNISAFNLKSTASYIIWTDGSTIYALNGTTGTIDYSGTDAATVINNAVTNIDEGIVYIKSGLYILSSAISLKSNIEIIGEKNTILKVDDGAQINAIEGTGVTNVHISNLEIDGNYANNTEKIAGGDNIQNGIYLSNCTYCHIENVISHDNIFHGIFLVNGCSYNNVKNCILHDNGYRAIHSHTNCTHNLYDGNICYNDGKTNYGGLFVIYDGNNYNTVTNNIIINDGLYGIALHGKDDEASNLPSEYNLISNNMIYSDTGLMCGIYIQNDNFDYNTISNNVIKVDGYGILQASGTMVGCQISNNFIKSNRKGLYIVGTFDSGKISNNYYYNDGEGSIYLKNTETSHITDNYVFKGDWNGDSYDAIHLEASNYNTIMNNYIYGAGYFIRYGIYEDASSDYNVIAMNRIYDIVSTPIVKNGDHTDVYKNYGYTTENSGTSEITGDGTNTSFSISHGLATTPSQVLVTPTNSSMASATWWVSAKTSTTFTITFSTAPSNGDKLSFDWYAEV